MAEFRDSSTPRAALDYEVLHNPVLFLTYESHLCGKHKSPAKIAARAALRRQFLGRKL